MPARATLVVLMGLARSAPIASLLIDRGWPRLTPAAIVVGASLPGQQVWRGTLAELTADRLECTGPGPGTIVIGAVVSLAAESGARQEEQHVGSR